MLWEEGDVCTQPTHSPSLLTHSLLHLLIRSITHSFTHSFVNQWRKFLQGCVGSCGVEERHMFECWCLSGLEGEGEQQQRDRERKKE